MFSFLLCVGLVSVVFGCGEDIGEVRWVESTNNVSPDGNFPYGQDRQGTYFVCRGKIDGEVFGGSYLHDSGNSKICRVARIGEIKELEYFEVLACAPSSIWSPVFMKLIPNNAYAVGKDIICRGTSDNNPTLGTIGYIMKFDEETAEWTKELTCNGIVYSNKGYAVGTLNSFNILTLTNREVITDADEESNTFDLIKPNSRNLISFNAKASEDLTMIFKDNMDKTVFEILLGGLYNSLTAVRTPKTDQKYTNSSYTPYVLDELSFVGYFLYWDESSIAMGQAIKYPNVIPPTTTLLTLKDAEINGTTKFSLRSSKKATWHISCQCDE